MVNKIATVLSILAIIILIALPIIYREEAEKAIEAQRQQQQQQQQQQQTPDAPKTESPQLNYNLSDVVLIGHTKGVKQWELKVKDVTDEGQETTAFMNLKDGELYQSGKTRFYLSAETGEYDRQRDEFSLRDNVVIKGVEGEVIKTNELHYDNMTHQVKSGPVNLEQDQSQVRAGEMKIDVDNEVFEFEQGVEIDFTINKDDESGDEPKGGVENVQSQNAQSNHAAGSGDSVSEPVRTGSGGEGNSR